MSKIKLISSAYHRNGVCGHGFYVSLFKDEDGSVKVMIEFPEQDDKNDDLIGEHYAVLQVDRLAKGDIGFGTNSWRGDNYVDTVGKLCRRSMNRKWAKYRKGPVTGTH